MRFNCWREDKRGVRFVNQGGGRVSKVETASLSPWLRAYEDCMEALICVAWEEIDMKGVAYWARGG